MRTMNVNEAVDHPLRSSVQLPACSDILMGGTVWPPKAVTKFLSQHFRMGPYLETVLIKIITLMTEIIKKMGEG